MRLTASPSEVPGVRLNDSVTAGNCPWWLTDPVVVVGTSRANWLTGIIRPPAACTYRRESAETSCWYSGASSITNGRCSAGVDLGDITLPERVVERAFNEVRVDPEPGRHIAIDLDHQLRAGLLQIAGDVLQARQCL